MTKSNKPEHEQTHEFLLDPEQFGRTRVTAFDLTGGGVGIFTINVPTPEGVDEPDGDWYFEDDLPQYVVDHINQTFPPVLAALNPKK